MTHFLKFPLVLAISPKMDLAPKALLLLILFLGPRQASASATYKATCSPNKELTSFESPFDTANPGKSASMIGVRSATDGHFSNRNSNQYDRQFFRDAVDAAIKYGIDPYYFLATLVVERAPFDYAAASKVMPWKMYYEEYGIPPLDSIAASHAMGCKLSSKPDSAIKNGVRHNQYTTKNGTPKGALSLRGENGNESTQKLVLALLPFRTGQPPRFEIQSDLSSAAECTEKCCLEVNSPASWGQPSTFLRRAQSPDEPGAYKDSDLGSDVVKTQKIKPESKLHQELTQTLGAKFKKELFENARNISFVKSAKDPYQKLALKAQAYNGYGTYGATEATNSCLHGLSGSSAPVYGAGVMDLTLNMMMSNSELRAMVGAASTKQQKPVQSIFCGHFGAGTHKIDAEKFSQIQKKLIGGRAGCETHTYSLKTPSKAVAPEIKPVLPGSGQR